MARRASPRSESMRNALTHLREAWLELVAAGRMSDAAEVDTIRKRLGGQP